MSRNVKKRKSILYKDKRGLFALNDLLREEIYQKVQTEKKMELRSKPKFSYTSRGASEHIQKGGPIMKFLSVWPGLFYALFL